MVKVNNAGEVESSRGEYYFQDNIIQFAFIKTRRLLDDPSQDTVKFELLEERLYFENGRIFKALQKSFTGIDGVHDDVYMNDIPNQ